MNTNMTGLYNVSFFRLKGEVHPLPCARSVSLLNSKRAPYFCFCFSLILAMAESDVFESVLLKNFFSRVIPPSLMAELGTCNVQE